MMFCGIISLYRDSRKDRTGVDNKDTVPHPHRAVWIPAVINSAGILKFISVNMYPAVRIDMPAWANQIAAAQAWPE